MKIKHRVPVFVQKPDEITAEYENEVRRSTERGEREHEKAVKRLAAAERRLAKVRATPAQKREKSSYTRDLNVAVQIVEARRRELADLERLMAQSPQSATHRGTKSFRPIGKAS